MPALKSLGKVLGVLVLLSTDEDFCAGLKKLYPAGSAWSGADGKSLEAAAAAAKESYKTLKAKLQQARDDDLRDETLIK